MKEFKKAYLQMHIATLLFGFTAILGALIQLPAVSIVWWRVFITSLSLLFFISFGKKLFSIPRKYIFRFCGIGIIVGLHWICFYGAVKLANSSVALICMAFVALFTSFFEPLLLNKKFKFLDMGLGIIIIPAMVLIVKSSDVSLQTGFLVGTLSAMLASLFTTLNKKYLDYGDFYSITFLELGSATIFISFILPIYYYEVESALFFPAAIMDWVYIIILALVCTTFAYVLALKSLKYLTAFYSNLIINLEPIYGILLAIVILKEHKELNATFYIGCFIIILAILGYPILKRRY
jgi:drug/metabolite transporter (DMT)-like permease